MRWPHAESVTEFTRLLPALAKISCEPNWRWQKREKPMANYDLFYVWSGEGWLELNDKTYKIGKGSCFLFRPGDHTSATHNPQKPLVLTYIHFDVAEPVEIMPKSYRVLQETVDFEYLLSRYVRLFLIKTLCGRGRSAAHPETAAHPSAARDYGQPPEKKASNHLTETIHEIANYIRQHPGMQHRVEDLAMTRQSVAALFRNQVQGTDRHVRAARS